MDPIEQEIKNKWVIRNQSDEDLKKIAKDLYNGLIYTDRHCGESEIMSRFMVLMFMGPKEPKAPSYPSEDGNLQGKRDNTLYDLVQREEDQKKYETELKNLEIEKKYYSEYLKTIGLIYEYLDSPNRSPMSMNGGPIFMSCRFLNRDDAKKMFEYYETYKEIREKADNF